MASPWSHVRDVLLHMLGAAAMVAPCFLTSTPTILALPWSIAVAAFWFLRELAQKSDVSSWSAWKWAESIAPMTTALACGLAITLLRTL